MKDAFVPSSVLRLRRRLSEDKMINIDIADVLFAGMVFPVMKFVKKIVLPRVRKAWEKVKEVAKKMACTEAPPVSDLESQSESNGSTDDLDTRECRENVSAATRSARAVNRTQDQGDNH